MTLRRKIYQVSPEIDVPDGISYFVAPMQVIGPRGPVMNQTKFMRYTGLEEILGNATFVFRAPDNMENSAYDGNAIS